MLTNDGKLDALVKKAMEEFNKLTPEEKFQHRRDQAISWVAGEMALSQVERGGPDLTKEAMEDLKKKIGDIYDRRHLDQKDLSEE